MMIEKPGVGRICGFRKALAALMVGVCLNAPVMAEERDYFSVESGRVQSVSVTPLSVTIDERVFLVTEETHLRGRRLSGEPGMTASRLREIVGRDVGYSGYQVPGQRPVVLSLVPIKSE